MTRPRLGAAAGAFSVAAVIVGFQYLQTDGPRPDSAVRPTDRVAASVAPDEAIATTISEELTQGLREQGIRVTSAGDLSAQVVDPSSLREGSGDSPEAAPVPAETALLRITDDEYGEFTDVAGPRGSAEVKPYIQDRLVWLTVFKDVPVPFGGSYITAVDESGRPMANPTARPDFGTTDLFVIHDARTGEFLEAGSL